MSVFPVGDVPGFREKGDVQDDIVFAITLFDVVLDVLDQNSFKVMLYFFFFGYAWRKRIDSGGSRYEVQFGLKGC